MYRKFLHPFNCTYCDESSYLHYNYELIWKVNHVAISPQCKHKHVDVSSHVSTTDPRILKMGA